MAALRGDGVAARRRGSAAQREMEELIQALMQVPEAELLCRDPGLRHKWEREENFHLIQAVFRGVSRRMVARDTICERCGKLKQERWTIGRDDVLDKAGNYYSRYEVQLRGFRGRVPAVAVWTAGYRLQLQAQAPKRPSRRAAKTTGRRLRAV